jgi:CBS domain-containing protein
VGRKQSLAEATVGELMRPDPVTVQVETPLSTAVAAMLERRINCLPVTDERGTVCGILTSTDLPRVLQRLQAWIELGARGSQ